MTSSPERNLEHTPETPGVLRSTARRGRTLKLHLTDGTPPGVMAAELGISPLRAATAFRTTIPELIRRDEANQTEVYLLVGPDPSLPGRELVHAGEGDQTKMRFVTHDSDGLQDFFTRVILMIPEDENLTKAHGRYLEGRIDAGTCLSLSAGAAPIERGAGG